MNEDFQQYLATELEEEFLFAPFIRVRASPFRVGGVFEGGAGGGQKACALRKELSDLARLEKSLDELIHSSTAQLKQLTELEDNKRYPLRSFSGGQRTTTIWQRSEP